jgi:hypothetical protein
VGGGNLTEPLSVRARFERFPATVKGAFILRGEDADPHQVVFREANVVGIGLGVSRPMPMAGLTLDVVPHRDLFVPFEMPVSDLDPGWYTMTCDLEVDGVERSYDGGRRFSVAWPRATVRRGVVRVDRSIAVGDARVTVEQIECGGDSIRVHLRVEPPGPVMAKIAADGHRLEVLETEVDETTGRGRLTAYPLLRTHGTLRIDLRGRGRGAEGSVEVDLPA